MSTVARRRIAIAATLLTAVAGIIVYFLFNPERPWFPSCPVYRLTGWLCPGCGSQRAIHALLHGDITSAWTYNAMMLILAPLALAAIIIELAPSRFPRLHKAMTSRATILTAIGVIVLWTIARNL